MHRSGTSLFARGLLALGVELGTNLTPADAHNPTGYWEDADIVQLNDRLIGTLGVKWHSFALIPPERWATSAVDALKLEAASLLRARFGSAPVWGFKDPRMCRLLPFWRGVFEYLGLDDRYLIVIRNPISVAESLYKRDGFPREKSHLLWVEHVIPALNQTTNKRRILADYDDFMNDPASQLVRVARGLGMTVSDATMPRIEEFARDFAAEDLRHTEFRPDDLDRDRAMPRLARQIYRCLMEATRDRVDSHAPALLEELRSIEAELEGLSPLYRHLDALEDQARVDAARATDSEGALANLRAVLDSREAELGNLRSEFEARNMEITDLRTELEALNAEVASLHGELRDRDQRIGSVLGEVANLNAELQKARLEMAAREYSLQQFQGSNLWRVTAPLRWVRRLLSPVIRLSDSTVLVTFTCCMLGKAASVSGRLGIRSLQKRLLRARARAVIHASKLFDSTYYLASNLDVAAAHMDPLNHFLQFGAAEGRNPSPEFDAGYYLRAYRDVADANVNPLLHYIEYGEAEGRRPIGPISTSACTDNVTTASELVRANDPDGAIQGFEAPSQPYEALAAQSCDVHASQTAQVNGPDGARDDFQVSSDAYEALSARWRDVHASRVAQLSVRPPALIRISEGDDLGRHASAVSFAPESAPEVSIVVPVLNNVRLTVECLLSIARFTTDVSFEVVVFDNGSTDATATVLSAIPNLVYLRSEENLGFVFACNEGARGARGRYLVFLNNDTQVTRGWLSALIRTFTEMGQIGAVGPKVLFPDGRLQEAGVGINPDCTSSLIGFSDDPDLPCFSYRREVDYVSGVCLMVEAGRFQQLGGFDGDYAPAYCEDVDLCLRLRALGLRIVYDPSAVIVHHLSMTSATVDTGYKMQQVTKNQQRLAERHQAQIDALNAVRVIAFYLPQFHPIRENDVWWGKGFTDWRNVSKARPNFEGHYQPRLPADVGFYDLRVRETYAHQVDLAERYGVSGFCFYYYWFAGHRLLERPLERLLEDPSLSFPFCVCWANENWTRRWDGQEHEILMSQSHSDEDDIAVICDLMRYMRHPAYIRIDGRPLLLVYRPGLLPNISRAADTWRTECRTHGMGEIYLVQAETFELTDANLAPQEAGFDASVEFPPHGAGMYPVAPSGRISNPDFCGHVFDYNNTALHYMTKLPPSYTRFRTAMTGWDNTARRQDNPNIFLGSTPGAYQAWLEAAIRQTREQHFGDERIMFVNAWNEWAEGAYLEPDLRWKHAYLEATKNALDNVRLGLR
jgi:GT2 family glycosyltransferase